MLIDNIKALHDLIVAEINNARTIKNLDDLKAKYLSKKSEFNSFLKMLGTLSPEERPKVGALINEARNDIDRILSETFDKIQQVEFNTKFESEKIDITLKGRKYNIGSKHPIRIVFNEIEEIFLNMGFSIAEGPEVETDFNNFTSMNFLDDHPARDSQDTFYVNSETLFRTHTSPVQARAMQQNAPNPLKIICPGRVFRRDDIDATHSVQFHQIEGLFIDKNVRFSDLIGVLEIFMKRMFGESTKIRLRPSFFPFTEPSAEVDCSCIFCKGKGCSFCKHSGWIEILGSGAVHPNVLKMGGYDPEIYSGWAFGIGVDRVVLLKYGISDIRLLTDNDVRFIEQFK